MPRARQLSAAPRYLVGGLMIVITVLVNVEVAFRFLLNLPLDGLSEMVIMLFPWLTLLGAAVALGTPRANVALHLLEGRLSERPMARIRGVIGLVTFAFGLFMVVQGARYALMTRGELSNVLDISRSWEILAFPVAGLLFCAYSLVPIVRMFRATSAGTRAAAVMSDNGA